jgi:hypothetical protein
MTTNLLLKLKIVCLASITVFSSLLFGCNTSAISAEVNYVSIWGGEIIEVHYIITTHEYNVSKEYTVTINIDGNERICSGEPIKTDFPLINGIGMEYEHTELVDIRDTPNIKKWYEAELVKIQTQLDKLEHDYYDLDYKATTDKQAWLNVNVMNDYLARLDEIRNKVDELQEYKNDLQSGTKTEVTSKLSRFISFEISEIKHVGGAQLIEEQKRLQ